MTSNALALTAASPAEGSLGRRRQTVGYFAAFVALGLTIGTFGPTLPGLAAQVGASLGGAGFLFMARSLGYLVGSSRGGRLFDSAPGHALMAAALFVMALTMALVPLAPALWVLIAVLLVLGAAEGTLDVGGNVMLVRAHGAGVGPYMNGLHFFFGVGALAAPVVVAQAGEGVRLPYWILAAALLPVAGCLLRLPSPGVRPKAEGDSARQSNPRLVALIALFLFLYVGAEVSFGGWIYTYTLALKLSGAIGNCASASTRAVWSPGSSGARSSPTTCGATRSTPRAGWNPPARPAK